MYASHTRTPGVLGTFVLNQAECFRSENLCSHCHRGLRCILCRCFRRAHSSLPPSWLAVRYSLPLGLHKAILNQDGSGSGSGLGDFSPCSSQKGNILFVFLKRVWCVHMCVQVCTPMCAVAEAEAGCLALSCSPSLPPCRVSLLSSAVQG